MASESASATTPVKDIPLELPETPAQHEDNVDSNAADQQTQEIDIEGTEEPADTLDTDVPMELTTPLSSGSELNLSFEGELVEEKEHQDKLTSSSEVATIKKDDETMDVDVVGEGAANTSSTTPRPERVDSVNIDPSFQPESEELLYEGDVENDGDENKSVAQDIQPGGAATSATATTHEEGFVLAVDDTFADLDEAISGKSPKKQELSSSKPPPSENKSSSKSQLTSGGQSSKAKSEGTSSSSSATATASSSSKHSAKESGKLTPSGTSENASPSRFVYCRTLHHPFFSLGSNVSLIHG